MNYRSLPTVIGRAKLENAALLGQRVNITKIEFGDGNGAEYEVTGLETALRRKVYECPPNHISQAAEAESWIEIQAIIPHDVGGWYVREYVARDDAGDAIFIGNIPESFKPLGISGAIKDIAFEMLFDIQNADTVTLKVDPSRTMATVKFVNDAFAAHLGAAHPHSQYLLRSTVAADAGPLAWLGVAGGTANALTFALVSEESKLTAYKPGQTFQFKADVANTAATTAKIGTLAALPIKKPGATGLVDLSAGDIKPGAVYGLVYDGAVFQLASGAGGGGGDLFAVEWWPNRATIPLGRVPADGQLLTRLTYPEAAAGVVAGAMPTAADATWLSTPTERGKYTAGDGATTFRVPDYNGKAAGSLGALFLRGDGALSAAVAGAIQPDEIRKHRHPQYEYDSGSSALIPDGSLASDLNANYTVGYDRTALIGYAGGAETRPLNVTGCWVIRLFGAATNAGTVNAAQLATDLAALIARVSALEGRQRAIGDGQDWADCTALRSLLTTFTNNTAETIIAKVTVQVSSSSGGAVYAQVGSGLISRGTQCYLGNAPTSNEVVVPPGKTYRFYMGSGSGSLLSWWELRK